MTANYDAIMIDLDSGNDKYQTNLAKSPKLSSSANDWTYSCANRLCRDVFPLSLLQEHTFDHFVYFVVWLQWIYFASESSENRINVFWV